MPMYRRLSLAALLCSTLLAGAHASAANAATLPSNLMLPDADLATHGIVERWVLNIKLEASDLKGIEPCRQVLAARGFTPVLSKLATSARPELHFKIEGNKEYAQANVDADEALAAVQQAQCKGTLSWAVIAKPQPR
jgi:hypothetical protein